MCIHSVWICAIAVYMYMCMCVYMHTCIRYVYMHTCIRHVYSVHGAGGAPRQAQVLLAGRGAPAGTHSCLQYV